MRSTLLLFILVAGLLIYIFSVESEGPSTTEKIERQTRPFSFRTEKAAFIRLTNSENEEIEFEKNSDGNWIMTKPIQDHADPDKIKSLLEATANMEWIQNFQRKDLGRGDITNSGIDDPRATISVADSEQQILATLTIGKASSIEGAIYASTEIGKEPQTLHLTRTPLTSLLPIVPTEWRDQKLVRLKADAILNLMIDNGTSAMEFERDPNTRNWTITKPLRVLASTDRVNAILNAILNLKSAAPTNATPKPGDSTLPPLKIRLVGAENSSPTEIILHANTELTQPVRVEVNDRPDHYQTSERAHDLWRLEPNHLRDQQLAHIDPAAVTALRLNSLTQGEVSLLKVNGEWQLKRFGKTEPAHSERISQLFERLNIEQIREFVSDTATNLEPYGLHQPFFQITWEVGDQSTTLQFGLAAEQNKVFASYKGEPFVYRISPSIFNATPPDITKWRSVKIINASLFAARELSIIKGDAPPLNLQYNPDQSSWTGEIAGSNITDKIDIPAANLYLQQLLSFEASDWSSERRDAYAALRNPALTIKLKLVEPGQPETSAQVLTLTFAPTMPGRDTAIYHGRLDGDPDTFYITREAYHQLLTKLIKE